MQPHFRALRLAAATAAMLTLCVVGASAAEKQVGTVTDDGLRMREQASTDSVILTVMSAGDHVVVVEDAGEGWYKVDYCGAEGYMSGEYLTLSQTLEADLGYGKVVTEGATLNVRSGPSTDCDRVGLLEDETVVDLTGMDSGWFRIERNGITGYVSGEYIVSCEEQQAQTSTKAPAAPAAKSGDSGVTGSGISTELGEQIVAYAQQYLGKPYTWGGNGPNSFDCSGFTKYVFAQFGYNLNRTASAQLKNGYSVSRSELQPGDLVFFYNGKVSTPVSHVGIYIGGGSFIHASTNDYQVRIDTLTTGSYDRKYVYARRVI